MNEGQLILGDCRDVLGQIPDESVDLVYLDPPFFSQRDQSLRNRGIGKLYQFSDTWLDSSVYAKFLAARLELISQKLAPTGSIIFHCDKSATHIVRFVLDEIFGQENFRSEIIWHYKRWSNSKKGLLNAHQTLHLYSKTNDFKFNPILTPYSESTNVDQIMQKRKRDSRNKAVYARDSEGNILSSGTKRGVPLSDVWDIPFLNPKAKERVGYPTQKPVLLLDRIIRLFSDESDIILDPFCGSGTTLVAAKELKRKYIGIDISEDAIALSEQRLENPVITQSNLMRLGRSAYKNLDYFAQQHLSGIPYTPVQRNKGIDALLAGTETDVPIFIRVQREDETIAEAASQLLKASKNKGECRLVVVATSIDLFEHSAPQSVTIIQSTLLALTSILQQKKLIQAAE